MIRQLKNRTEKAATIAETAAGLFIMIPIFLLLADVAAVLIAQTQNDSLAKQAARAASEKRPDEIPNPQQVAQQVVSSFGSNNLVNNPRIIRFVYNQPPAPAGSIYIQTRITCILPVPVPLVQNLNRIDLDAEATETIVALPP